MPKVEPAGRVAVHLEHPKYLIYESGAVVSLVFRRSRVLTPIRMGEYFGFQLLDTGGKIKKVKHHRLIAQTFHGRAPEGQETRHKNGKRDQNDADNLHWGTRSQNMMDKELHGTATIGERHPGAKLNERKVRRIRRLRAQGLTIAQIEKKFPDVTRMTIWRAAAGKSWTRTKELPA